MAAKKAGSRVTKKLKTTPKKVAKKARAGVEKAARKVAGKAPKRAPPRAAPMRRARGVQPIPTGFHTVTPSLICRDADRAIDFYKEAFGAKETGGRMRGPDGKVMHAELRIGDSVVMLMDEMPERGARSPQSLGGSPSSLLIYSDDVDSLVNRAVSAGATVTMPVDDQFWGDRYGRVVDPFGHEWELATHKEDLTDDQMKQRMMAMMPGAPTAQA